MRVRILFADGSPFALGEGVIVRDRVALCAVECDREGWAEVPSITDGPALVYVRMADGELQRAGGIVISAGRLEPSTIALR